MQKEVPNSPNKPGSPAPNVRLEIAFVRIARTLFDYIDSQYDAKELHQIDRVFLSFEQSVASYHNATGRLHPDLCYDLGEWSTLKGEALEATEKSQIASSPIPLDVYRKKVLRVIEDLEREVQEDALG